MTPGARIQAVIELLDTILTVTTKPADAIIGSYFKGRRYIGSKDRGFIAELVYFVLRNQAAIEHLSNKNGLEFNGRTLGLLGYVFKRPAGFDEAPEWFGGSKYHPAPLTENEQKALKMLKGASLDDPSLPAPVRFNFPAWMEDDLRAVFGDTLEAEMRALNTEAPVDLRTNTLQTTREALIAALKKEDIEAAPTPFSPWGVRLTKRQAVFGLQSFKDGWFEMQDEASQLVSLLVDAGTSMKVIDFCAGAGGKTLAIAAAMKGKGRILAWDVSEKRMADLPKRLRRAGAHNVQSHLLKSEADAYLKRHVNSADRVLVDAPCSGSGTWRRNPDLKWRFSAQDLQEIGDVQERILSNAARLVKTGGRLIYVTCSLLKKENEERIEKFLKNNNNFRVVPWNEIWDKKAASALPQRNNNSPYFRVSPHQGGMDGFFAAIMERTG